MLLFWLVVSVMQRCWVQFRREEQYIWSHLKPSRQAGSQVLLSAFTPKSFWEWILRGVSLKLNYPLFPFILSDNFNCIQAQTAWTKGMKYNFSALVYKREMGIKVLYNIRIPTANCTHLWDVSQKTDYYHVSANLETSKYSIIAGYSRPLHGSLYIRCVCECNKAPIRALCPHYDCLSYAIVPLITTAHTNRLLSALWYAMLRYAPPLAPSCSLETLRWA